ncbi:MAG: dihydroorotate dehydrogenase electron transfer subunit [Candidatus Methylomirabilales bacterium]
MQQVEMQSLQTFHPDYFLQRFASEPLSFQPGQFVMVKPSGSLDPFLPRAYSILRVRRPSSRKTGHVVEILYKVMGKGSTALSRLKSGDRVDLLGPLGNGYHVSPSLTTALLVAGGIGVPPVVALAERLARSGFTVQGSGDGKARRRSSVIGGRSSASRQRLTVGGRRNMVAFIGGKTSNDVLCLTELRKAGAKVHVATEDGSVGHQGLVVDLLESHLRSQTSRQRSTIYACGPHAMLHAVAQIAERFQIPCQVSLEASMACGFGACMGCVIPVHRSGFRVQGSEDSMNHKLSTMNQRSYKLCCTDGPAFDAREIAW